MVYRLRDNSEMLLCMGQSLQQSLQCFFAVKKNTKSKDSKNTMQKLICKYIMGELTNAK